MNNTYTPAFAVLVESIGGYFGLLGLGWILAGDITKGLLLLFGYSAVLAVGGALTFFSLGCLAAIPVLETVPPITTQSG